MDRLYARELPNKPWPAKGEIIDWSGKCFFSPEMIKRNIASTRPGVLFEKRPLLPFFDSETGEVLPNTKIALAKVPNYARPIYKGLVGDDKRVIVKFHPMPQNYDPSSPWAGIKAVNVDERHLHYGLLREARAYEKLEHLQGSVVPHCYGFYEVCERT